MQGDRDCHTREKMQDLLRFGHAHCQADGNSNYARGDGMEKGRAQESKMAGQEAHRGFSEGKRLNEI